MNKHAEAFMDYFQSVPEPTPAPKKAKAKPAEPVLDHEAIANDLYVVLETLKEHPSVPDFVREDLIDVIEQLVPGYLAGIPK